jgi:hypothetical protein
LTVPKSVRLGLVMACTAVLAACAHFGLPSTSRKPLERLSKAARLSAIRRAQVWRPTAVPSMDMWAGPNDKKGFAPKATVLCDYVDRKSSGHSPKFLCAIARGDVIKVKYGQDNGEVYAEVAATRLLWALGFGADHMYPATVECRNCPADPAHEPRERQRESRFYPAAVERKMPGETMESFPDSGWSWPELDLVSESAGGAPRAHRDALKLMAVLMQHTDSKASQQRLMCLNPRLEDGQCAEPFMMINDLGLTFGHTTAWNTQTESSVNLEAWAKTPVWADSGRCVGNLPRSATGTLDNPVISEEGRSFLADLLMQLSDAQLHDLFAVAQFPLRSLGMKPTRPMTTVDEWVDAFKAKRDEIVNRSCA